MEVFLWPFAAVFFVALLARGFDRWLSVCASKDHSIEGLRAKLSDLEGMVLELKVTQETTAKQAEQVQKLISQTNLASAFQRK